MSHDWYLREDGETFGPYSKSQLVSLARSGRLSPGTRVRNGEEGPWQRAADVPGLYRAAEAPIGATSGTRPVRKSIPAAAAAPKVSTKLILLLSAGGAGLLIAGVAVIWLVIASLQPVPQPTETPVAVSETASQVSEPSDEPSADAGEGTSSTSRAEEKVADASPTGAETSPKPADDDVAPPEPVATSTSADEEPILPLFAANEPEPEDDIADSAPVEIDTRTRTDAQITEFTKRVKVNRNATDAYSQLKSFSTRYEFTEVQRVRLDLELGEWKKRADANLCRLGAKWVPEREVLAAEQKARDLIKSAAERLAELDFEECIKLLKDASRVNPNGVRAEYTLGLLYSLPFAGVKAPETAERHFRNVLQRRPDHPAALNSLAIAQIKQREYGAAAATLTRAATVSPVDLEITQNAGRFIMLAEANRLPNPQDSVVRRFRTLYRELTSDGGEEFNERIGWMHMLPVFPDEDSGDEPTDRPADKPVSDADMVALASGTGFVIAPGYVLTNRHVVDATDRGFGMADEVRTIDPGDAARERELRGKVFVVSLERDLALIKFDGLQSAPVLFEIGEVAQASDVLILGFPKSQVLGSGLKTTRGIVSALPDPSRPVEPDYILFDATADHGNSGGPVVNQKGHAVAVLTVGLEKLSGGETAAAALSFLRQHVPDFDNTPAATSSDPELADWAEVTKTLSPSVRQLTCYYSAGVPELDMAASRANHSGNVYEDQTCPWCNGRAHVACMYRGCISGRISIPYFVDEVVGTGQNAQVISRKYTRKEACPNCGGNGGVDCQGCTNGFDDLLP